MRIRIMKSRMRLSVPVLLAGFVFLAACGSISSVSTRNLSYLYDPEEKAFGAVQSVVFNSADTFSTVYLRMGLNTLQNLVGDSEDDFFFLHYSLHTSYISGSLVDSGRIILASGDIQESDELYLTREVVVKAKAGQNYVFQLWLEGFPEYHHTCLVNRSNMFGQQDVLLTDESGEPLFDDFIQKDQTFKLVVGDAGIEKLDVSHFKRSFDPALPPFAFDKLTAFDFMPDSTFSISLDAGVSGNLQFPAKGFYHIQKDPKARSGKTLYRYYEAFPTVNDPERMLEPLRYLTTSKEFQELQQADDTKLAVDRFWLAQSGNVARARIRIRDFYSRVEEANILFSSYHEGWKTDRGIIYIIYGPPKVVYRTDDSEKWIYGEAGNSLSMKFNFTRIDNPFTLKDYSLNKSPVYKESWYNAVESWRR